MLLGITPAKVAINDAEDGYAVPTPGSAAGALQSDASGVARILWKAGGSGTQWCVLQFGGAGSGSGGGYGWNGGGVGALLKKCNWATACCPILSEGRKRTIFGIILTHE